MDGTLGQVFLFAGNFAPSGWAFCEGQLLPINGNEALFSILAVKYGGDGRVVFGLPKMTSQDGVNYIICISGQMPARP